MAGAEQAFRFAQFEYPWPLGPPAGRYVLREPGASAPARVLVLATLGAPERRLLRGRRPRIVEVPVLTPRLSSYWLHLVTPVKAGVARPLIEGLRSSTVAREHRIRELVPFSPTSFGDAARAALSA